MLWALAFALCSNLHHALYTRIGLLKNISLKNILGTVPISQFRDDVRRRDRDEGN